MRSLRCTMFRLLPVALALVGGVGCASMTNPTTYPSVPVRRLPDEMLAKSREEQLDIPQPLLRIERKLEHNVDAGDTLGIIIEGILGPRDAVPPIQYPPPGASYQNIGIGYPIAVMPDGTIGLPSIPPLKVAGLKLSEVKPLIEKTYIDRGILQPDAVRVSVSLLRPRLIHVLVVRQDSSGVSVQAGGSLGNKRGSGVVLDLSVGENDVLTALTRSGGLPGEDAKNEVMIQRGALKGTLATMPTGPIPGIEVTRIPLRLRPGEPIPFKPEDVVLEDSDIMFIQSRDTEVFYVAGLITSREIPIPRDHDLDVLTAVALVSGPLVNGGVNTNNQNGSIVGTGLGAPSPSQVTVLRKAPGKRQIAIRVDLNRCMQDPRERILIMPGDVLILQETLGESVTRYITGTFRFAYSSLLLNTSTSSITSNGTLP